jgi:hypothetical protein
MLLVGGIACVSAVKVAAKLVLLGGLTVSVQTLFETTVTDVVNAVAGAPPMVAAALVATPNSTVDVSTEIVDKNKRLCFTVGILFPII